MDKHNASEKEISNIRKEINIHMKMVHKNIVRLYNYFFVG